GTERLSKPKQRHSFSRSLRCKDDLALDGDGWWRTEKMVWC
ncbi:hypothetical protein Tco_0504171, partial [Tanacetum coccineum]